MVPIVMTIEESGHGRWCICCGTRVLFEDLRFAHAIKLVRGLARQKQVSSKRTVLVEMASREFTVILAQYGSPRLPESAAVAA
jgi:hypothetical protein